MKRFYSFIVSLLTCAVLLAGLPRAASAQVASDVTIDVVTFGNYQGPGPSVELRVYALNSFLKANGTAVVAAQPGTAGRFYTKVTCAISSGSITCPSITVPATEASPDNPNAKLGAFLYTPDGQPISVFSVFDKFQVPASPPTTTWADIRSHNIGTIPPVTSNATVTGNLTVNGVISGNGAGINNIQNSALPATISGKGVTGATITGSTIPLSNVSGAGTMASQSASAVNITGGSLTNVTCTACVGGVSGSGGVDNPDSTVIGAANQSTSDATGFISFRTRQTERMRLENLGGLSLTALDGSAAPLVLGTPGQQPRLYLTSLDTGNKWGFLTSNSTSNGVLDNTLSFGWNPFSENTSEHAWFLQLESSFKTGPNPGDPVLTEFHLNYRTPGGFVVRPIGASVDRATNVATIALSGDSISILNSAGTQKALWDQTTGWVLNTGGYTTNQNNVAALTQMNASATALVEVARIDANNDLLLGGGVTPVRFGAGIGAGAVSSDHDLTLTKAYHTVFMQTSGGNRTITLPQVSTVEGMFFRACISDGSNNLTLLPAGGDVINDASSYTFTGIYKCADFVASPNGVSWYVTVSAP